MPPACNWCLCVCVTCTFPIFLFLTFFFFCQQRQWKHLKFAIPPSNVFLSWRRIRVHVRSSPKWLKIYDINKNTKRTTLTRKTRAAAATAEQREEIPQQEMFSGPVRFRLDGCAKPQGTHPPAPSPTSSNSPISLPVVNHLPMRKKWKHK